METKLDQSNETKAKIHQKERKGAAQTKKKRDFVSTYRRRWKKKMEKEAEKISEYRIHRRKARHLINNAVTEKK